MLRINVKHFVKRLRNNNVIPYCGASLSRQAGLTESNERSELCNVLAISNMVKHLGVRDAEGNLGTLRALLRMSTNLSQAFI